MNCLEAQEVLQQWLDGERPPETAELGRHLAACPDCRELFQAAPLLERACRSTAAVVVPPALTERIVRGVERQRRVRQQRRRWALAGLAVAAAVLVAAYLGPWRTAPQRPAPAPVERTPLAQKEERPDLPPPSLNEEVLEARAALRALWQQTAGETVDSGKLLVPEPALAAAPMAPDAWDIALDEPARALAETGQHLSSGLSPVTGSARRAVDLFLRGLPSEGPEPKPDL